jgi:hypothetical protein
MKNVAIFLLVFSSIYHSCAQTSVLAIVHDYSIPAEGRLTKLTEDISVPEENAGYTLLVPENGNMEAVIIQFNSGRDTTHEGFEMRLYAEAIPRQVAVLFVTTGNRFEFLFEEKRYAQLDGYIGEAIEKYNLPKEKILFTGMSLAGTRAAKFGAWCLNGNSKYGIKPTAIATCDAPLDFVRFWKALDRSKKLKLNPISANEAEWVTAVLEKNLGGTPNENLKAYQNYSPYCHECPTGGNAFIFKNIAFRNYTEPDVKWWMENRGNDYYSMNAMDAAGLINQLKILGNKNAELILTENKGYKPDGSRHPHSWSIVNNAELVEWLLRIVD